MTRIDCISGYGTAWENAETRKEHEVDEIYCLRTIAGLYYCPQLHVVFQRLREPEQADEFTPQYCWEYATFPALDKMWERNLENPFWKMGICRIDAPRPEPISEEEFINYL